MNHEIRNKPDFASLHFTLDTGDQVVTEAGAMMGMSGKLNIETNHATLAGHEMMHELEYAGMQGALGSIDANTGDLLLGWDTDQFATDYYLTTQIMLVLLKYGLSPGGVNFDAKVRRESF